MTTGQKVRTSAGNPVAPGQQKKDPWDLTTDEFAALSLEEQAAASRAVRMRGVTHPRPKL
ncbi:MAG TPA: hypothetical protein DCQ64_02335 [Candidatus Rokubacteria bacterium]|nr:hypothetical protein [Candidatus Rokubacteria bacterium]